MGALRGAAGAPPLPEGELDLEADELDDAADTDSARVVAKVDGAGVAVDLAGGGGAPPLPPLAACAPRTGEDDRISAGDLGGPEPEPFIKTHRKSCNCSLYVLEKRVI